MTGYEIIILLLMTFLGLVAGKFLIPLLGKFKFGQTIREEGPEKHKKKTGTPTMGGLLFFFVFLLGGFLFAGKNHIFWFMTVFSLLFGMVGFIDDFLIIKLKSNEGLRPRNKFLLLLLIALAGTFYYLQVLGYPTTISFRPLGFEWDMGALYYLFAILMLTATTNAVNITDGLDGLAASLCLLAGIFFLVVSHIYNLSQITLFILLLLASCLSFLFYNKYPAKVFMGDTGSLFLGGALASLAMFSKTEIILPLLAGVFLIETLSVILQVLSFKLRGKRIFKMSPLHHHFELSGWRERKIVLVFNLAGLLFLILSLLLI